MNVPTEVRKEAELVRAFTSAESDLYTWFRAKLEAAGRSTAALVGDPKIGAEARAVYAGRLSLINELLAAPERLLTLTERPEPEPELYVRGPAPVGAPSRA